MVEASTSSREGGSPAVPLSPGDSQYVDSQDEDDLQDDKNLVKVDIKEEKDKAQVTSAEIPFEASQNSICHMDQVRNHLSV